MSRRTFVATLALSALLLAACTAPALIQERHYRLDPPPVVAPLDTAFVRSVVVLPVQANGTLGQRGLLYRVADEGALMTYPGQLWVEAPSSLLASAIEEQLRALLQSERIYLAEDRAEPDILLRSRLLRFESVGEAGQAFAELALEVTAADAEQVLFQTRLSYREPVVPNTVGRYVAVQSALLSRASADIAVELLKIPR